MYVFCHYYIIFILQSYCGLLCILVQRAQRMSGSLDGKIGRAIASATSWC
jgi:hypothetical protein